MSTRQVLLDALKPQLPKRWKLVPYQTNLDTVDVVTVMFKIKTIGRTPAAPRVNHTVTFTVTIIEPKDTPGTSDDALDDELDDLLFALDATDDLVWRSATRVTYNATNPAYDIDLDVITAKGA